MNETQDSTTPFTVQEYIGDIPNLVQRVNVILQRYSDKDWNYSRIRLRVVDVTALQHPYLLGCEFIDPSTREGSQELKNVRSELTWGEHHSSELGILELISLRLNKALIEVVDQEFLQTGPDHARGHPVIRLVKRQDLIARKVPAALWYEVQEVSGEEFDNR